MSDFEALLKRSFAEAEEPADDGFSAHLTARVARREVDGQLRTVAQAFGLAAAGGVAAYVMFGLFGAQSQDVVDAASMEVARAHGVLSAAAPQASFIGRDLLQTLGAGLTQVLLVTAALVGGAVAYRSSQD